MTMGPFVRVALHMIGAMLVGLGHVPEDVIRDLLDDPELVGAIVLGLTWLWYFVAKKLGWKT